MTGAADMRDEFDTHFRALTGNAPFPWQRALFLRFTSPDAASRFPATCNLPTGLGKTSILAVWLLALAHHAQHGAAREFPRRLVYVVNRRTVVDQSTREAERLRLALQTDNRLSEVARALHGLGSRAADSHSPLAISTLRGQFADNAEWRDDPARPAIIAGTVDMIGSRLLFSGYGRGFKSRPLHAAFLGQDALLIHDEAHLEPAFQRLLEAITVEQQSANEFRRLHVIALSATARADGDGFGLSADDLVHPEVVKRVHAMKGMSFIPIEDPKDVAETVATLALTEEIQGSGGAILVFLRRVEDVGRVADRLSKAKCRVQTLTGTMRGLERDELVSKDPIFARFMPRGDRPDDGAAGTVYLVCTSAGEVGVNISADHLICDLAPFDSMAQRLGRVNRFGEGDARVEVIAVKSEVTEGPHLTEEQSPFGAACRSTFALLSRLPIRVDGRRESSPAALGGLPSADRLAAFTPAPAILSVSDVLFDSWALTTIRGQLPGRPPVADWLHGEQSDPPQTLIAWRHEVGLVIGELADRYSPEDLLEDYPIKPHELLRDRSSRVLGHLTRLAEKHPNEPVWVVDDWNAVSVQPLGAIVNAGEETIEGRTLVLSPRVGGLEKGLLNGSAPYDEAGRYDVADLWIGTDGNVIGRQRTWDDPSPPRADMRLVRRIDLGIENETDEGIPSERSVWRWWVDARAADDDGSRAARSQQGLTEHLDAAGRFAEALAGQLVDEPERSAVVLAARWHDLGKARRLWQRSIGNPNPSVFLAKSGPGMNPIDINAYRHEFGSLVDLRSRAEFGQLEAEKKDLVLHLVAAHHGRARPHFPEHESFDPEHSEQEAEAVAKEVPPRFARLQARYGRWGLAYLESLVRAADILASQSIRIEARPPGLGEAAE